MDNYLFIPTDLLNKGIDRAVFLFNKSKI